MQIMRNASLFFGVLPTLSGVLFCGFIVAAEAAVPEKATDAKMCLNCHKSVPGQIRAEFDSVAMAAQSMQLKIDNNTEVVRFNKATLKVLNPAVAGDLEKSLLAVKRGHQVRAEYTEKDGVKTVSLLSIKPPLKVAPEKILKTADIEKLIAVGPQKGGYTLVDSRPLPKFQEGAIPTAINIPYPAFKKSLDKLPASKDALLIFYCQGATCALSPNSAREAEVLGYNNVKVYYDGIPEWTKKNYVTLNPQALKEAWFDKDIPFVLLDVRSLDEVKKGFIRGAVAIDPAGMKDAVKSFPDKGLKPPIIIYDDGTGEATAKAAMAIIAAGYANTKVLAGGYQAWTAAGFNVEKGATGAKIVFTPKLRPGELTDNEFMKIAGGSSSDNLLLDVRSAEEVKEGVIKGSLNIPVEEIPARLAEIPKAKKIVIHCSSGVRAEMAYVQLKDKGYDVRYLNAIIDVGKDGKADITR